MMTAQPLADPSEFQDRANPEIHRRPQLSVRRDR